MNDKDLLKLAQLHNAKDLSKERKLDLVKGINVHYSIPNDTYKVLHTESYPGYNCLHIAALNLDYDLIVELLSRGADLFKQGTQDHKTSLHVAIDSIKKWKGINIWEMSDKLENYEVVDTLLSAHVTSGNSLNPKCKNGISHLHIACMFNCTEVVAFLLNNGESPNHVTRADALWPGYTPLHFAARYSCVKTAQCLIDNRADVVMKDSKGISPLHILVERLFHKYNHVSLDRFSTDICYEEEIKEIETILVTSIKSYIENNVLDDTGLAVFHIACALRDTSVAAQLLKDIIDLNVPVSMDSKFWAGWTPLHFAACSSAAMVKLLVQRGADITVKNERKQTPLDICLKRYFPSVVHSILSTIEEFRSISFSDKSTSLLDVLLAIGSSKRFNLYLESLKDSSICVSSSSPILPRYNLLHLALSSKEKFKFQSNIDFLPQDYNCPHHVSEVYSNRIRACLAKECSVTVKNFDGLTPIHLAFYTHCSPSTLTELLSKCNQDALDPDNLSLLHIACAAGHLATVKKLINARQTNVNATTDKSFQWYGKSDSKDKSGLYAVNANSTPLHIAVTFAHKDVIDFLLDHGANVYAQDAEGFTPIHLSLAGDHGLAGWNTSIASRIFSKVEALKDRTSKVGLTHLHVAVHADLPDTVKELVSNGAKVNDVVGPDVPEFLSRFAGKRPLQLAIQCLRSARIVETLIELGADTYVDGLVQHLMDRNNQSFFDKLKLREKVREPIEPSGLTLLHVACDRLDVDWAEELLKKGANANARIRKDCYGRRKGYTPLHVLAFRTIRDRAEITEKRKRLVGLLLEHDADFTIASDDDGTALHINIGLFDEIENFVKSVDSSSNGEKESATTDTSFNKKLQVNPVNSHGSSFLHYACIRGLPRETVEKLLNSGVDVNRSTCPFFAQGDTALHLAAKKKDFSFDTANLLMEHEADVNAENAYGETPLHLVASNMTIFPGLLDCFKRHRADFNAKNIRGQTPVDIFMAQNDYTWTMLEDYLTSGSSITCNGIGPIRKILLYAAPDDRAKILKSFGKYFNFKDASAKKGYNPIQEVLCSWPFTVNEDLLDVIQSFIKEGCDVNQRSLRGEESQLYFCKVGDTPLHTFVRHGHDRAVNILFQVGADIDNMRKIEEIHVQVRKRLALQVLKMKSLDLYVNGTIGKIYDEYKKTSSFDVKVEESCKRELEKAKSFRITDSLNINVFLSERKAIIQYLKILPETELNDIDIFFKRVVYLNKEFPELAGIMICQYQKAARSLRLKFAEDVLVLEGKTGFTELCLRNVLKYFTNNELEYLIENSEKVGSTKN